MTPKFDAPLVRELAARFGTPLYAYSRDDIEGNCRALASAFSGRRALLCYAVKANSNLSVLNVIFKEGFGADVVSVGELQRTLEAGCPGERIVFSGVGKQPHEIQKALAANVLSFNVESVSEIDLLAGLCQSTGSKARVCLRVNPNIDARTNPYIATGLHENKFGMPESDIAEAARRCREAGPSLQLTGLACHIGSQITDVMPLREAATRMAARSAELIAQGFALEVINLGGGLGIRYRDEKPPSESDYATALYEGLGDLKLRVIIEPGRSIVGNAGVLIAKVLSTKATPKKTFVICDAGMNDLIRPALYEAWHGVTAIRAECSEERSSGQTRLRVDVVGPVCETGDFLAVDRDLDPVEAGDFIVIHAAGAYGMSMASHYNTRPKPAEVLIERGKPRLVRRRENYDDLVAAERNLP